MKMKAGYIHSMVRIHSVHDINSVFSSEDQNQINWVKNLYVLYILRGKQDV